MNSARDPDRALGPDEIRSLLSRLMDGDCQGDEVKQATGCWRDDAQARDAWHRYHLIGDVLRSEELADTAHRDLDLVARLRERLAAEPTIVAPAASVAVAASAHGWHAWVGPAAVAAGFLAVAGVLVVARVSLPPTQDAPSGLAGVEVTTPDVRRAAMGAASNATPTLAMDATLIRDAQIDRYLRAHREMRSSPSAAMPGGALRSVDTIVPQR